MAKYNLTEYIMAMTQRKFRKIARGIPRKKKALGSPTIPPPTHVLISARTPVNIVSPCLSANVENLLLTLVTPVL